MTKNNSRYMCLFSGAGGMSEGFIRAGFLPVTHIEVDQAACFTLKTRIAYHWLKQNNRLNQYNEYLYGQITRNELYDLVPHNQTASVLNAEIRKENLSEIFAYIDNLLEGNPLDLIIGGPPCQAYSHVGRSRDKNRMQGDPRNYLYVYYAEFLKRYKPEYFIFENVTGLLSAKDINGVLYFDSMRKLFRKSGYETEYKVLSSDEYGILQSRKRVVLIGKRGRKTGFYTEPKPWKQKVTVQEIFSDLPSIKAGEGSAYPCRMKKYSGRYLYKAKIRNDNIPVTWHLARPHKEQDLEIYRIAALKWSEKQERLDYNDLPERLKTHKNRSSFRDRFKVVGADLPYSHTVVAHISQDGHYYIHPDIKQNRSITPREAARLQTFPDDYFFEGVLEKQGRTAAYRQIGNAVPVLLAQKIAEKLKENW